MDSDESREDATVVDSDKFDLEGYAHMRSAGTLAVSRFGLVAVTVACLAAVGI